MTDTYYALHDPRTDGWSVVKTVEFNRYLTIEIPDSGSAEAAERNAEALNVYARRDNQARRTN